MWRLGARLLKVILVLVWANLSGLALWTGLPQRANMRFSLWFLQHQPTNWSAWGARLKGAAKPVVDVLRKF